MSADSMFLKTLRGRNGSSGCVLREDRPYNRTTVFRVFGRAVEGETYHLKKIAEGHHSKPASTATVEAADLQESSYYWTMIPQFWHAHSFLARLKIFTSF